MDSINRALRILDQFAIMGMLVHIVRTFKSTSTEFPRGLLLLLIIVSLAVIWDLIALAIIYKHDCKSLPLLAILDIIFLAAVTIGVVLFAPWVLNEQKNHCRRSGGFVDVNVTWGLTCIIPKVLWGLALGLVPSFLLSAVYDLMAIGQD